MDIILNCNYGKQSRSALGINGSGDVFVTAKYSFHNDFVGISLEQLSLYTAVFKQRAAPGSCNLSFTPRISETDLTKIVEEKITALWVGHL